MLILIKFVILSIFCLLKNFNIFSFTLKKFINRIKHNENPIKHIFGFKLLKELLTKILNF